jgi:hypothetical protein
MEIWEPKPPGTFWATPGLLWDCFTYYLFLSQQDKSLVRHVEKEKMLNF